jgi:hypothetical protein
MDQDDRLGTVVPRRLDEFVNPLERSEEREAVQICLDSGPLDGNPARSSSRVSGKWVCRAPLAACWPCDVTRVRSSSRALPLEVQDGIELDPVRSDAGLAVLLVPEAHAGRDDVPFQSREARRGECSRNGDPSSTTPFSVKR